VNAPEQVRIAVVDDHAVVRGGIRRLLDEVDHFEVVGEAGTADAALETCDAERPDVVVLDLGLGDRSGLEILPELIELGARVVVLSMQHQPAYAQLAFERGASAYVLKDAADTELIEAIHTAMDGGSYVHPILAAKLATGAGDDDLTGREREILRAIALGHTNQEIAGQLHLSVRTIEAHRRHVATKLRLNSRAELVRYAREHGLLDLG
jgi:two-component system, NarL family, response regulator NreC